MRDTQSLCILPVIDQPPAETKPLKVLVVDDLSEICTLFRDLRRRIRTVDVELKTETNSQRALEMISRESFDLVISDFRMREVDGIEVLRAARVLNPRGYRILMTGYNEIPAHVSRILDARVDAYLQKPLEAQEILLILLHFLHQDKDAIREFREHAREMELLAIGEESEALGASG